MLVEEIVMQPLYLLFHSVWMCAVVEDKIINKSKPTITQHRVNVDLVEVYNIILYLKREHVLTIFMPIRLQSFRNCGQK